MLREALDAHLNKEGFLRVDTFMALTNTYYYAHHVAIGKAGDFLTAPAMGQLFGEMVAVWIVQQWNALNQPSIWHLVELGSGQGELLLDVNRVLARYPIITAGLSYHSVENSPLLRQRQANAWSALPVYWHADTQSLPTDAPIMVIANEFLDALPIRQALCTRDGWRERIVVRHGNELAFAVGAAVKDSSFPDAPNSSLIEFSPMRNALIQDISARLQRQRGASLFIDYGYTTSGFGDTLQALYRHRSTGVFAHLGKADLTAHVDFATARAIMEQAGLSPKVLPQATFLHQMGLRERLAHLAGRSNSTQQQRLLRQYQRLTDATAMGTLFKVLWVLHD